MADTAATGTTDTKTAATTDVAKTDAAATTETKTDASSVLGAKTEGTTDTAKTEGEKTEGKTEDKKSDAKPTPLASTDFKLPDGFKIDESQMGSFLAIANELGLPKEKAQALVDLNAASVKAASEASSKAWADQQKAWQDEAKTTYGNEPAKNPKIIAVSKMIDSLGEKPASALRDALEMSGMGNHPAFVAAFAALAERLTEPAHAKGNPPGRPATAASAIYPNMNQG